MVAPLESFPFSAHTLHRFLFLWSILLIGLPLHGTKEPPAVRSIGEFWALPLEAKQHPVPFRFECDVTYYDDEWRMLWVQDSTGAAYIELPPQPLAIQSGQRIEVTGTNPPGTNLSFVDATIRSIGLSNTLPQLASPIVKVDDYSNRLVTVDAIASRDVPPVSGHQRYHLSIEGRPALAWVRLAPGEVPPDLTDTRLRLTGVYNPGLDGDGGLAMLTLMVASTRQIEVIAPLAEDPRFDLPRTPIDQIPSRPSDRLVRIAGTVITHEPGISITLRDESGQLELRNAQTTACPLGSTAEAIGFPRIRGSEWHLFDPVHRPLVQSGQKAPSLSPDHPIRMAAQIAELPPDLAQSGLPVRLRGIVTWSHPEAPFFFLADTSGSVRVYRDRTKAQLRGPGRRIEVLGTTRLGPFAPAVDAHDFTKTGETIPPPAVPLTLEHAMTGEAEAHYVEMRGYVRALHHGTPWNRLIVATPTGDFTANIAATEELGPVLDSVVRLRGVCSAITDSNRRLAAIELWLPEAASIQIAEAAKADPFDRPERSIASLGRSGSIPNHEHRIKVRGTVLQHAAGLALHIVEGDAPLLVLTRDTTAHPPGEQVEAVGFLGRLGRRLALHESIVRRVGATTPPPARPLAQGELLAPEHIGQLVRIEGMLTSITRTGADVRLTTQAGGTVVEADLRGAAHASLDWTEGSRLALTGVHELQYDVHGRPTLLHLHLRTPQDVLVLEHPPWLNRTRILAICIAFGFGTLLFAFWGAALRRRVEAQTRQIRRQLERETHLEAELQRTSKLEALGLLAGGIAHDFNNLLTVVMGNLSLVREAPNLDPDSLGCLEQAELAVGRSRDLTMQLLTFAKGGNPIRAAVSIGEVVQEVARFALHGSVVRAEFDIAPDLWPAEVDKGQISQVVQNLVINAVQAMPNGGNITIALTNETIGESERILAAGRYVKLAFADDGTGIPAEALPRIFDPYFTTKQSGHGIGLATVHSIVKKHQGHITVASEVGRGTTFTVWLPASSTPVAPSQSTPTVQSATAARSRVLVMDDEDSIRRLSCLMLQRLGLEATGVADGAEAIRLYREAREGGNPFHLVVLDLTIPGGIGGEETIRELLKIDPEVQAIVSSGYSNSPILSDHQAYGFKGMVSKPYELADLAVVVDQLLGSTKGEEP